MIPILVTSVVSVVSVPLYFRVLGTDMYAMWFYVGTLTGAFGFMDLGLGVAVGRFIGVALGRDDQDAVREYWATGNAIVLPFVLFFAVLFIVVGGIWGPQWFKVTGPDSLTLRWAVVWGGFGLFFAYYGQMWNILAQAYLDFKYLSILRTWMALLSSLGSLVVALVFRNVAAIFAFTMLLGAIQFLVLLRRGHQHYKLPLRLADFRKSRFTEMLPYTLKTFGQLISGSVLGSLDRVFLGRLAPAADFAAFGVSQNIGGRIAGLSVAIMGPIFHNTTRGVGGDASKKPADVYRESFAFMFPWYSLLIIGVAFWSGPVTQIWLGPKYGTAVGLTFPWVVAGLSLNAIANISGAQLGGLNKVGTGLILQSLSALLSAAGVVAGWYLGGLVGASIGFLGAKLVWFVQDALVRQWIGLKPAEYLRALEIVVRQFLVVGSIWAIFRFALPGSAFVQFCGATLAGLAGLAVEMAFQFHALKSNRIPAATH